MSSFSKYWEENEIITAGELKKVNIDVKEELKKMESETKINEAKPKTNKKFGGIK